MFTDTANTTLQNVLYQTYVAYAIEKGMMNCFLFIIRAVSVDNAKEKYM